MTNDLYVKIAGVSGSVAVALAAYGAHKYRPVDPFFNKVYEAAQTMHILHSLALLSTSSWKHPDITGPLFVVGTALFSGTCYLVAFTENRMYSKFAPVGGITLMTAWLSIAF